VRKEALTDKILTASTPQFENLQEFSVGWEGAHASATLINYQINHSHRKTCIDFITIVICLYLFLFLRGHDNYLECHLHSQKQVKSLQRAMT
jgi:hypothetical protein